jgi:phage gpG-like protein
VAGVRGNFAGLVKLRERIGHAMTPQFQAEMAQGWGAACLKELMDEFKQSRDPYGRPWKKLALRRGRPLLLTGRMRASASVRPRPAGFELVITAAYAATHQYGFKGIKPVRAKALSWQVKGRKKRFFAQSVDIPRRQMIPDKGRLGKWGDAIKREGRRRVATLLFKGRRRK